MIGVNSYVLHVNGQSRAPVLILVSTVSPLLPSCHLKSRKEELPGPRDTTVHSPPRILVLPTSSPSSMDVHQIFILPISVDFF